MPFKSRSQQRFMFSQHPEIAKEFAEHTDFSKLPEKAKAADGGELINQDGLQYTFKSGKDSSLTAPAPQDSNIGRALAQLSNPYISTAKTVPSPLVTSPTQSSPMDLSTYLQKQQEDKNK